MTTTQRRIYTAALMTVGAILFALTWYAAGCMMTPVALHAVDVGGVTIMTDTEEAMQEGIQSDVNDIGRGGDDSDATDSKQRRPAPTSNETIAKREEKGE